MYFVIFELLKIREFIEDFALVFLPLSRVIEIIFGLIVLILWSSYVTLYGKRPVCVLSSSLQTRIYPAKTTVIILSPPLSPSTTLLFCLTSLTITRVSGGNPLLTPVVVLQLYFLALLFPVSSGTA